MSLPANRKRTEGCGVGTSAIGIGTRLADKCDTAMTGCGTDHQSVRQFCSLIQTETQTYRTLPLILNPRATFHAQHASGDVQKFMRQGLVIKAAKDELAPNSVIVAFTSLLKYLYAELSTEAHPETHNVTARVSWRCYVMGDKTICPYHAQ